MGSITHFNFYNYYRDCGVLYRNAKIGYIVGCVTNDIIAGFADNTGYIREFDGENIKMSSKYNCCDPYIVCSIDSVGNEINLY